MSTKILTNNADFKRVAEIALSNTDLSAVSFEHLHGIGARGAQFPVFSTVEAAAALLRYQVTMLNGQIDQEELQTMANVYRYRVILLN